MTVQTPLGRVRGLGSAKSGVEHFWHQRLTAAALVPLTLWFVWLVARYAGAPHADVVAALSHPINAALMLLFVIAGLYHMVLGLNVVVEDYITTKLTKLALIFLVNFSAFAIAMVCAVAIMRIAIRF